MRRPCRTAATMRVKRSSSSTMDAASRATSVPRSPMAMPTSAAFSAGASFTPSPVIATTSPACLSCCTRRSLWLGCRRAQRSVWRRRSLRRASSSDSISAPVSTSGRSLRPTCRAMARAVAGWSPVIMITRMPACRHSASAAGTSSRGGSSRASRPRNWKGSSRWLAGQRGGAAPAWAACVLVGEAAAEAAGPAGLASAGQWPSATPSRRRPWSAQASTCSRSCRRCSSLKRHRSATASGAPLQASSSPLPAGAACTRVMASRSLDSGYSCSAGA